MSLTATLWALDKAPVKTPTAVLVLIGLADEARDDGTGACPYIEKLVERARCSERSVQNYLRELYRLRLIDLGDQTVALRRYNKRPGHAPRVWDLNLAASWDNVPTPRTEEEMEAYSNAFFKRSKAGKSSRQSGVQDLHPSEVQDLHPTSQERPGGREAQDLHPSDDLDIRERGVQILHPSEAQQVAPQPQSEVQPDVDRGAADCTSEVQPTAPFPNPTQNHPSFSGNSLPSVESSRAAGAAPRLDPIQPTLTGEVPAQEPNRTRQQQVLAFGIARRWIKLREDAGTPIVVRGKGGPLHALVNLIQPALAAGYTEAEVGHALLLTDKGIPSANELDKSLAQVRSGVRAHPARRPAQAANRHIDSVGPDERRSRNPLASAVRSSDAAGGGAR